jgi:cell division transport system permease protein
LTFALLSTVNLDQLQQRWEHAGHVSVYLTLTATDDQVQELKDALGQTEGVRSAEFVSSDRARADLLGQAGNTLLEALPEEAFPPSIEVTLEQTTDNGRSEALAAMLGKMSAVESVETYQSWVERIGELVHAAVVLLWLLAAIVFVAVVAVVASTTRLALHRRRDEVEVLRFVGATSAYVRGPFLIEGAMQGAFGAVGALLASAVCFGLLSRTFGEEFTLLLGVAPSFLPWTFCLGLVACGAFLGALAAYSSLRRSFES